MANNNFLDNVVYVGSTLAVSGDAIAVGSTDIGAKSVIFSNSTNAGHLAWNPSAVRTINLPDANGTLLLSSQAVLSISAGTTRVTSGEVVFSNSNNVSFGVNGQTITGSVATSLTNVNVSAGTTSNNLSAVVFSNSNGVSFGLNGSTVTGSVATSLTNINVSAGTTSTNASAFVFSNANNFSFGLNGATVTGSYTVPTQTNQTEGLYAIGNTTGQSSSSTFDARTLSVSGAGIVSVGYSGNALVVSASTTQTNQTVGLYALGNTTQNSSTTLDARTISLNGLGAVTVGYSNGSVQISAPVQTAQTQSNVQGISAGTQVGRTGDIVFSNSNGISFGMSGSNTVTASYTVPSIAGLISAVNLSAGTTSNNASAFTFANGNNVSFGLNASTITASVATSLTNINISAGTTSGNLSAVTFSNANGVSFGLNASTVTASVAAQTNQTVGLYAVSNTTQNSSTTLDARTISFQGAGIASVGYSNGSVIISVPTGAPSPVNFSAGTTSSNLGSVVFSNSNGVSFGLNGATITASAAGGGGGATLTFFATGNTTQNSSTSLNQSSILFNAIGAMTAGYSNGSIQLSAPATSVITGTGGINVTVNGSTISVSGHNMVEYERMPLLQSLSTTYAPAIGSWYFEPFFMPANISGGHVRRIFSFGSGASLLAPSSSSQFASGTTGSRSVSFSYVNSLALFALGTGTNSTRLESVWSNTFSIGLAQSVSVSSAAGTTVRATNAATISYVASIDSAGSYTTSSLSQSGSNSSGTTNMNTTAVTAGVSNIINMLSGQLVIPVGFNSTISPGNYWLAQAWSTASTTAGTAANVLSMVNQVALAAGASALSTRMWGQTSSNSTNQHYPGQGAYSITSNSPPSTLAFTQIGSIASNLEQYFNMVNTTI